MQVHDTPYPDTSARPVLVVFQGIVYRLLSRRRYYLSQSTTNAGRKRPKGLHVAIWEHYHGRALPPGHHVHHKDTDQFNNNPSNLECLTAAEHRALPKPWKDRDAQRAHLAEARELTKAWHRSEEGRAWHRANGKAAWTSREPIERVCVCCGQMFIAFFARRQYCSTHCYPHHRAVCLGRGWP